MAQEVYDQEAADQEAAAQVDAEIDAFMRSLEQVFTTRGASIDPYSSVTHIIGRALAFGDDRAGEMSEGELENLHALRGVWSLIER